MYDPASEGTSILCPHGISWMDSCILCGRSFVTAHLSPQVYVNTAPSTVCPACHPSLYTSGALATCPVPCTCNCHRTAFTSPLGP